MINKKKLGGFHENNLYVLGNIAKTDGRLTNMLEFRPVKDFEGRC